MPFAAALSTLPDTAAAIAEATGRVALAQPDLAVLLFSPHHAGQIAAAASGLRERLGAGALIGCVGESIVGGSVEVEQAPALSLWLGQWNGRANVEPFLLTPERSPDGLSLLGWPDSLMDVDPARSAMLVLGDPFSFPVMECFLPRLEDDLPGLRVMGGMASGQQGPGEAPLLYGDGTAELGAVGVLLTGDVGLRCVVSQGCRPIGRPLVITKGRDTLIEELSGQTPLQYLQELWPTLPPMDQDLLRRGLHVGIVMNEYRERFARGDFLIRNLYGLDRQSGALAVMDRIRVGQTVQFQVRDAAAADEDLTELLRADRAAGGTIGGALLFSCNGRGTRLFDAPNHDATAIRGSVGEVPLAGFFAAGELGPVGGKNYVHGFTASVALFEES